MNTKQTNWTKEDDALILSLRAMGKTNKIIAEAIRRTTAAVRHRLWELDNGLGSASYYKNENTTDKNSNIATESKKVEEKTKVMTPREMIKSLYDMGYRIEDNHLVCYVRQTVKLQDIING